MKRDVLALLMSPSSEALGSLARAIALAERRDHLPVWRAFVLRLAR